MKSFGNILFFVVLLALGYAIYPSLSDHFGWDGETSSSSTEDVADFSDDEDDTTSVTDTTDSTIDQPSRPTPPATVQQSATTDSTSLDDRFPYPQIKSLDEITSNWTAVPERALPSQITLKKELQFTLGTSGFVTKPADSDVYPVGTNGSLQVRVAMAPGSANEELVAMDDTDFKERVTEMYNNGVAGIRARVDAQPDAERTRVAAAASITEAEKATVISPSATTSTDEIEIMKSSIARGELAGITPGDITTYRKLGFEKEGQTVFQIGAAVYDEKTMFGNFQTEAKAFIREGRVVRWERAGN